MRLVRITWAGACLLGLALGGLAAVSGCGSEGQTSGSTQTTPEQAQQRKNMEEFYKAKMQKGGPRR
jgi:hypothetical protein